jgi:hypothetical protein
MNKDELLKYIDDSYSDYFILCNLKKPTSRLLCINVIDNFIDCESLEIYECDEEGNEI